MKLYACALTAETDTHDFLKSMVVSAVSADEAVGKCRRLYREKNPGHRVMLVSVTEIKLTDHYDIR